MTQLLPVTFKEAAALEYARERVAWFRANKLPFLGIDVAIFDDVDTRNFARQIMKRHALSHPLCMMSVVDDAKAGWDLADEALRELILEFHDRGEPLPTYLGAFAMDIVAGMSPKHISGPKKLDKFFRDIAVAVIVWEVAKRFPPLKPTRARFSSRPSACSVVASALGLAEPTVVTIWSRYGAPNLAL